MKATYEVKHLAGSVESDYQLIFKIHEQDGEPLKTVGTTSSKKVQPGLSVLRENFADFDQRLQLAMGEAPSDSSGSLTVTRQAENFSAILTVESLSGKFTAHSSDQDLTALVARLFTDLHVLLANWHKKATAGESPLANV
jgi:hypothetical protein